MSVRGLNWNTWTTRFTAGLNQKADPRALELPELEILTDAQFGKIGGLQTRYPYAALGSNIYGGGTISDARRLVSNGDELLLFTKDALYSWSPQLSKWVSKATHLAVKVSESPRFARTTEQIECDRAELSDVVVYSWTEDGGLYWAATDKTTGAVLIAPQYLGDGERPRLVALTTKILIFYSDTLNSDLVVFAIDPANLSDTLGAGAVVLASPNFNDHYDVVKISGADAAAFAARRTTTTSYEVGKVTAALAVTASTKARTCDGPIAVSVTPDGASIQVARGNGVDIQGDLITVSTLADTAHVGKAIGTVTFAVTINQIAACHKTSTDSGEYRCHVFWSRNESPISSFDYGAQTNWVDTGGNLGTQADLVDHVGVASRAWVHDNRIYVWVAFAAASAAVDGGSGDVQVAGVLQNTYFLYRDDGFLVAKAAPGIAGGFSATTGHLPGVASVGTDTYAWCGTDRRRLEAGSISLNYSDRGPREITIEFDSDEARRTARLGETLYVTGGEILQYDGSGLFEVGFHIYPWYFQANPAGAGGTMGAGTYAYKSTWRWDNGRGERERSTTATIGTATCAANDEVQLVPYFALNVTHKTVTAPAVEWWRTAADQDQDTPFYLVTSPDPAATGDNGYVANDDTAMTVATVVDSYADSVATVKETNPENGGVLESLSPPAATIIAATDVRLFLAGVAGDPHRVWYSKQRNAGEIAAFHEALTVPVPIPGGDITALALLNETLVVFRERAIYMVPGDGLDNGGGGANYGPARQLSVDIGAVNQESVAVTDKGIVFKSGKGWYLLNRGWALDYIGAGVSDYDDETPLAIDVVESQHQVRILTSARMLVFDTLVGKWSEWTIDDGVHACMWSGTHYYLTDTGPSAQLTTYTGVDYGMDVELAWLKFNDIQGYGAVDFFHILGEYQSACTVRVRLARDYWRDGADTYFQDKTHTPSSTAGMPFELQHSPSIRQVKALKVRITITPTAAGESLKLTGLAFKLGLQPGLNRNIPIESKQ